MTGTPLLVLGLLLVLSALLGARVRERSRGAVVDFLLSPLHPAAWAATAAILLGFWVELFAFALAAAALSLGASLLFVGIGIVIFGVTIEGCRLVARMERRRALMADARPLRPHVYRPWGSGLRDLLLAAFGDVNRWRDVVYVFVAFPLAVLEFIVVVALWSIAIWLLTLPIDVIAFGRPADMAPVVAVAGGLLGVALTTVAASTARGVMTLHRAVVAGLLCESDEQALARRVATLEGSRQAVLDVEASELRRIERDLHDGAQQRLVMLTIDLSLAAERIESDPSSARDLVLDAREQARQALAELRDLVRGIAPAILLDRGLVPALGAIAGRCPVPTTVSSTLAEGERLPDSVERAAYFVVAEALVNVAKHASATRCEIRARRDPATLVIEVVDDGAGGARVLPTGGLAGLAGRVEALDGSLAVDSPAGGPTTVRAMIPIPAAAPVAVPTLPPAPSPAIPTPPPPPFAAPQEPR